MPREHVVEAFLVQHFDAHHEAVQHLRRRVYGKKPILFIASMSSQAKNDFGIWTSRWP